MSGDGSAITRRVLLQGATASSLSALLLSFEPALSFAQSGSVAQPDAAEIFAKIIAATATVGSNGIRGSDATSAGNTLTTLAGSDSAVTARVKAVIDTLQQQDSVSQVTSNSTDTVLAALRAFLAPQVHGKYSVAVASLHDSSLDATIKGRAKSQGNLAPAEDAAFFSSQPAPAGNIPSRLPDLGLSQTELRLQRLSAGISSLTARAITIPEETRLTVPSYFG